MGRPEASYLAQRYYGWRGCDTLRSIALGTLLGGSAAETLGMLMAAITKRSTSSISFSDRGLEGL